LAPSFERAACHLAVLHRMTGDFREPVIWLLLAIIARGITEIVGFVLLDQTSSSAATPKPARGMSCR
jgi:hypothetical protein